MQSGIVNSISRVFLKAKDVHIADDTVKVRFVGVF